jgi:hypothetical protein
MYASLHEHEHGIQQPAFLASNNKSGLSMEIQSIQNKEREYLFVLKSMMQGPSCVANEGPRQPQ